MSKKPRKSGAAKGRKKATSAAAPVQEGPKLTMPNFTEVTGAVEKLARMKKSAQSAAGLMGEEVEKLVSKKHFDKKALGVIRSLRAMPDERFAITWPHILHYAKACGFDARVAEQPVMFEDEKANKTEIEKAIDKNADPKIRQLRPARSVDPAPTAETNGSGEPAEAATTH